MFTKVARLKEADVAHQSISSHTFLNGDRVYLLRNSDNSWSLLFFKSTKKGARALTKTHSLPDDKKLAEGSFAFFAKKGYLPNNR